MIERIEHEFPNALYGRKQIKSLTPDSIDTMLEHGWFRHGNFAVTSTFNAIEAEWRSGVMLRIALNDFQFKKRHRKLLRRNSELFRVEIGPYQPTASKEELWQLYKSEIHRWPQIPGFDYLVFRGSEAFHYCSLELQVFHEQQLVAFSVFDAGKLSIASLEAAWHPDFKDYSLGIFTMLLEIEFAKMSGCTFYYPGFIAKDLPMFQYKLRPGNVQYYDLLHQQWKPWQDIKNVNWLFDATLFRLNLVLKFLKECSCQGAYAFHILPYHINEGLSPLEFNACVLIKGSPERGEEKFILLGWHPLHAKYYLFDVDVLLAQEFVHFLNQKKWLMIRHIISNKFLGTCIWPSELSMFLEKSTE